MPRRPRREPPPDPARELILAHVELVREARERLRALEGDLAFYLDAFADHPEARRLRRLRR